MSSDTPRTDEQINGRCGGVVGLRVESAEALWLTWHKEALSCDDLSQRNAADFDRGWNAGMAQAFRDHANWLQGICRQAGYEIPRQPEPNTEVRAELLTSQEVQRVAKEHGTMRAVLAVEADLNEGRRVVLAKNEQHARAMLAVAMGHPAIKAQVSNLAEELEKDKARLDWLAQRYVAAHHDRHFDARSADFGWSAERSTVSLRDAIDSAMENKL